MYNYVGVHIMYEYDLVSFISTDIYEVDTRIVTRGVVRGSRTSDCQQLPRRIHTTYLIPLISNADPGHELSKIYDDPKTLQIIHINKIRHQVMRDALLSCSVASDGRILR